MQGRKKLKFIVEWENSCGLQAIIVQIELEICALTLHSCIFITDNVKINKQDTSMMLKRKPTALNVRKL